jgi:outer membrane lipoprotein-sorting protein
MHKMIIILLALFCVSCTLKRQFPVESTNTNVNTHTNENGNIVWASGGNEKFYMPESKNTIAFISNNGVVIYDRDANRSSDGCNYYYKEEAKLKICADGEAVLFQNEKMVNTGFVNLHNGY